MLAVLYGIYEFTFWASEAPVNGFEAFFEWLKGGVEALVPEGHLQSLMVSGIIDGVGGVLGFVPLIMFMFFAIAILEDSGYMARIAFMLDRILRWFGLHGNSVMAFIISGGISGGCAVPGVLATRTLRDPKERIATLLVVPFMNCGAKLPLFGLLIAAFFVRNKAQMLFVFTLLAWFFALFAAKVIRISVLRGPTTPFVMELPPYRMPTVKGLLIHTWERTWQYIKKAGTIILGISIILWALMTFPGLSKEEKDTYDVQRDKARSAFLAAPEVQGVVPGKETLNVLDDLYRRYTGNMEHESPGINEAEEDNRLLRIAETAFALREGRTVPVDGESASPVAHAYLRYRQDMSRIDRLEQKAALEKTVAGQVGRNLETITKPIGFDYKVNVALLGGFAAKEVIVSTLGTAYSLGEKEPEEGGALSQRLRNDPNWSPLLAFTLVIFTMLYVPCFATVIAIKKESSWKWAGFSVGFNLIVAYGFALLVYQAGKALGLGIS
jgi:ferrous iron transport protein B